MIYAFHTPKDLDQARFDLFVRPIAERQLAEDYVQLLKAIEDWNFDMDAVDRWAEDGGA